MLMKKAPNRTNKPLQSLHHGSIGYQSMSTRIDLAKKDNSLQVQLRTQAKTRKNTTKFLDE
jgi:hypothetical protein